MGVVLLDDPAHRNVLSRAMSDALAEAVGSVLEAGARAIVLAASPPVFCAGGSVDDLLSPPGPLADAYAGLRALADCPVPTIAAVGGAAIGAGVSLPLACDVIVVSDEASFDPRFLDVAIHPGGGHLWLLSQRVGRQGAAAMVLCGDVLGGEDAVRAGMAWRLVPHDDLLPTAKAFARRAAGPFARPGRPHEGNPPPDRRFGGPPRGGADRTRGSRMVGRSAGAPPSREGSARPRSEPH